MPRDKRGYDPLSLHGSICPPRRFRKKCKFGWVASPVLTILTILMGPYQIGPRACRVLATRQLGDFASLAHPKKELLDVVLGQLGSQGDLGRRHRLGCVIEDG